MGTEQDVLLTNLAFYAAFAERDLEAMGELWASDADVACMHPGWPVLEGRDAVMESWSRILSNPIRSPCAASTSGLGWWARSPGSPVARFSTASIWRRRTSSCSKTVPGAWSTTRRARCPGVPPPSSPSTTPGTESGVSRRDDQREGPVVRPDRPSTLTTTPVQSCSATMSFIFSPRPHPPRRCPRPRSVEPSSPGPSAA